MKKISTIFLIVCMVLCQVLPASASPGQDNSVDAGCNTLNGAVTIMGNGQLIDNAQSVILYEVNSDTLMYAYNADVSSYPASMVKILTALIAIEQGNMDDAVTVRADVLNTVPNDAVGLGLIEDEVLRVEDLLYCMMVASANDAAAVLADHVMGSQSAFVDELNRYAYELGCTNTLFTNVHGLHDPQQHTTARDICRILSHALKNETFRQVFGTIKYTVPATNKSEIRNLSSGNYLMNASEKETYYDSRVTGSRTGVTTDRDRCIASVAEKDGMMLICVVLGSESVYENDGYTVKVYGGYEETTELFDLGFNEYKVAQIFHKNQAVQQLTVNNGQEDLVIGTQISASTVLPQNASSKTLIYRYSETGNLTAPIEKGQKITDVEVWSGTVCVAKADLYAMNAVSAVQQVAFEEPGTDKTIDIGGTLLIILGMVFLLIIVGFVVLCMIRGIRISAVKKRSRRHSRNRRRSW